MPESAKLDRSAKLWYGAFRRAEAGGDTAFDNVAEGRGLTARVVGRRRDEIRVRVWLFGILATVIEKRRVVLTMPRGFSARDVIDKLARRYGAGCSDKVGRQLAEVGEYGRIFIDGFPVEDMQTPLDAKGPSAEFEIILLVAYEGG